MKWEKEQNQVLRKAGSHIQLWESRQHLPLALTCLHSRLAPRRRNLIGWDWVTHPPLIPPSPHGGGTGNLIGSLTWVTWNGGSTLSAEGGTLGGHAWTQNSRPQLLGRLQTLSLWSWNMVCAQQTIVTVVILAVRRLRLLIVLVGKQTKNLSFEFFFSLLSPVNSCYTQFSSVT